jgi:aldehyde:ferredoxin oxidoreductase
MSKILRINTKDRTYSYEDANGDLASLGGRALTSKMILNEVPPTCHPLSKDNKLVVAPGLLSGTPSANSGRISVGAKSPLTGGIKESNSGGLMSQKMAKLGLKAIVLEDRPDDDGFCLVVVNKDGVEIVPADGYVGLGNGETIKKLWSDYGKRVGP